MSIAIGDGTFNEDDVLGVSLLTEVSVDARKGTTRQMYPRTLIGVITGSGGHSWARETRGGEDAFAGDEAAALALDELLRSVGLVGMLRRDNAVLVDRPMPLTGLAAAGEMLVGRRDDIVVLRGNWGRPGKASAVVGDEHSFEIAFPQHGSLARRGGGDGEILRGSWAEIQTLVP